MDRLVIMLAILTTAACVAFLSKAGQYYVLPLWERPDSPMHRALRPSGSIGHLIGIVGTAMVMVGVLLYSTRKRVRGMQGKGPMRTWLNVHIYLCLVGPTLVTFHTALKFGGFAAYSYWSMMIVAGSGIIGRWIYQQFPREMRGRELSLTEVTAEQAEVHAILQERYKAAPAALRAAEAFTARRVARIKGTHGLFVLVWLLLDDIARPFRFAGLRRRLRKAGLPRGEIHAVLTLVKIQVTTARRLAFLGLFKRLFLYWHVTHLVFFVAMFVMLVMHVGATFFFGAVGG